MYMQKCMPEGDCSYGSLHVDPLHAPFTLLLIESVMTGAIRFSSAAFPYSTLSCSSEQVFQVFLSTEWLCSFEVIYLLPPNFLLYSFLATKCDYADNLLSYILSNVIAFRKGVFKIFFDNLEEKILTIGIKINHIGDRPFEFWCSIVTM